MIPQFIYTQSAEIDSSWIVDAHYNDKEGTLLVRMESIVPGGYVYYDVPRHAYDYLVLEGSDYYRNQIRGHFRSTRVMSVHVKPAPEKEDAPNNDFETLKDAIKAMPSNPASWLVTLDVPGFGDDTFFMPYLGDFGGIGEAVIAVMDAIGVIEYEVTGVNKI